MASLPIQGKRYTVQPGDTLQSLAMRAYGNPMKWSTIYRANATTVRSKNPDLIYPGEILFIPPEEELIEAKAEATASKYADRKAGTFTLLIEGREVPSKQIRFCRGLDLLASSWTGELAWTLGKDEWLDKATRRGSFSKSELYLGGALVGTGRLYSTEPVITPSGITKNLEFFSMTADLVDSSLSPTFSELAGVTLKQIVAELCRALGYGLVFNVSPGKAFDYVQRQGSEAVGAFMQRLAAQRGLLVTCDEHSRVVVLRSITSGKPVATLEYGDKITTEFRAKFDDRRRFAVYHATGQSGDGEPIESVAKDTSVPGIRQLIFQANDTDTTNIADAAAWRRSKILGDAYSVPFPVADWYDPDGRLWTPNSIVTVKAPALDIPKATDFVIRRVELTGTATERSGVLNLVPPWALAGEEPKEPWV